jgi:hypothetical protein
MLEPFSITGGRKPVDFDYDRLDHLGELTWIYLVKEAFLLLAS